VVQTEIAALSVLVYPFILLIRAKTSVL